MSSFAFNGVFPKSKLSILPSSVVINPFDIFSKSSSVAKRLSNFFSDSIDLLLRDFGFSATVFSTALFSSMDSPFFSGESFFSLLSKTATSIGFFSSTKLLFFSGESFSLALFETFFPHYLFHLLYLLHFYKFL